MGSSEMDMGELCSMSSKLVLECLVDWNNVKMGLNEILGIKSA